MGEHTNQRRAKLTAVVGLLSMLLGAMLVFAPGASAEAYDDGVWHGQGWDGESQTCSTFEGENPVTPGPGEFLWHFILTNFDGDAYTLHFSGGDVYTVAGTRESENAGAFHFYVVTPIGADPSGTYVSPGDGQLVISHCESGGTTTTSSSSTTSSSTTSSSTTSSSTTSTTEATTTTTEATTTTTEGTTTTTEGTPTTVLGDEVENTTTSQAPTIEVLDEEVVATTVATLPRTGDETTTMAIAGLALIGLGAVLVGTSRRRLLEA